MSPGLPLLILVPNPEDTSSLLVDEEVSGAGDIVAALTLDELVYVYVYVYV